MPNSEIKERRWANACRRVRNLRCRNCAEWMCAHCHTLNWHGQSSCRSCTMVEPISLPCVPGTDLRFLQWCSWHEAQAQIAAHNSNRGRGKRKAHSDDHANDHPADVAPPRLSRPKSPPLPPPPPPPSKPRPGQSKVLLVTRQTRRPSRDAWVESEDPHAGSSQSIPPHMDEPPAPLTPKVKPEASGLGGQPSTTPMTPMTPLPTMTGMFDGSASQHAQPQTEFMPSATQSHLGMLGSQNSAAQSHPGMLGSQISADQSHPGPMLGSLTSTAQVHPGPMLGSQMSAAQLHAGPMLSSQTSAAQSDPGPMLGSQTYPAQSDLGPMLGSQTSAAQSYLGQMLGSQPASMPSDAQPLSG